LMAARLAARELKLSRLVPPASTGLHIPRRGDGKRQPASHGHPRNSTGLARILEGFRGGGEGDGLAAARTAWCREPPATAGRPEPGP
jgi:hypothetical protein